MYLQQITIENLRSIQSATVQFPPTTEGNVTLLLGGNGAGKTSVLRAVALACLGPTLAESGFLPYRLVRERAEPVENRPPTALLQAVVRLSDQDAGTELPEHEALCLKTAVERWGSGTERRERLGPFQASAPGEPPPGWGPVYSDALFQSNLSQFLVFGYGATRRIEASSTVDMGARSKSRGPRYQRVAGLFEEGATLVPLSFWLPSYQQRNPGRARQIATLINKLLPAECRFLPKPQETETGFDFLFEMQGDQVPFGALSDGYRAFIGWIADLLYHISLGAASGRRLDETQGIALVDEIDLHLHPEWQRVVLPTLAQALPRMQFIVTSHSPLVAASLKREQVRVLQAGSDGTSVEQLTESIQGRTVDQLLRSPYFGLDSTRDLSTGQHLRELSLKAREGDVQASLDYLKVLAGSEDGSGDPTPAPAATTEPTLAPTPGPTALDAAPAKKKRAPGTKSARKR